MDTARARQLEAEVWKCLDRGDVARAIDGCERLSRDHPDYAPGWHTASQLALQLGNTGMALDAIRRATRIEPDRPLWLLQEARCWIRQGQPESARAITGRLSRRALGTAYENASLGMLLTELGERREAVECYRAAALISPDDARHFFNLASLQRTLGDLEEAEQNFDEVIRLDPQEYEAWKLRSELRTWTTADNHVAELESLLDEEIEDNKGRANICYALAKELEDIGDHRRSFSYLLRGAQARRQQMRYDAKRDLDTIEQIQRVFAPRVLREGSTGYESAEPIFVVGMPRTGTTLLERILGRHSDVFASGELTNFAIEMTRLVREAAGSRQLTREELVELSAGVDFAALGRAYVESTRPRTGHTPYFIDKLPLNYLYVGLIHLSLPNAKIIHMQRDPMDTCYAVFKTLFTDAYPFSYDLQELANYYVAYHKLMEHWHAALEDRICTIRYEDLVTDTESEAQRLFEFCGIDWQAECLNFHESTEVSTTASAAQVRRPVYSTSVGRWRDYGQELQPLYDILKEAGIVH